jgi:hypothetical protein
LTSHFRVWAALSVCGRQSARWSRTVCAELDDQCSSCSSRVLASLRFDPCCLVFLIARSLSKGPRGECRWSFPCKFSAGRAQIVCYSRCSTRGSGGIFGRSALSLRTIRLPPPLPPADSLPPPCGQSAPGFAYCLSPLLLELHFRVALSWVGPL